MPLLVWPKKISRRRPGPQSGPPGAHLTPLAAFQNSTPTMFSSSHNNTVPPVCWKLQPGVCLCPSKMSVPPCTSTYYEYHDRGKDRCKLVGLAGRYAACLTKGGRWHTINHPERGITDQAALRGLLNRLWDLNLVLRSVQQVDPATISSME